MRHPAKSLCRESSGNLKREIVAAVPLHGDTAGRDVIVQQVERPLHVARLVGFRVFLEPERVGFLALGDDRGDGRRKLDEPATGKRAVAAGRRLRARQQHIAARDNLAVAVDAAARVDAVRDARSGRRPSPLK
jgi:hypothetical protein